VVSYSTRIEIAAPPEEVFAYFVRPELLVRWMGDYARLEAVQDGMFSVDINGVLIRGRYVALDPPSRIEIAWGEFGNKDMPPGSTRLIIELHAVGEGTVLELTHSGLSIKEKAKHAIGWPHFLDRLAIAASGGDAGPDPWAANPPTVG
jgi:uncharacterized protein YndB with AHSA1/START domain